MLVRNALHRDARKLPLAREVENIIRRQSLANNGVWYDPSDLSTLFQDSTGATPVTAAGQPVGLILDKSAGKLPGTEKITNGDFSGGLTGWNIGVVGASTVTANAGACRVFSPAGDAAGLSQTPAGGFAAGKLYLVEFDVTVVAGGGYVYLGSTATGNNRFDFSTSGHKKVYLTCASTFTYGGFSRASPGVPADFTLDNVSVREIPGNHATQTTAGYKPLLQSENGLNYLSFDGSDDFLVTGNIDFSSSDKIAVAAGVRKLSDATVGIVCELSAASSLNNGSFNIAAPGGAGVPSYSFNVKGTVAAGTNVGNSYPSPITTLVSAANVISLDSTIVRANGVQKSSTSTDCGTGNYGNYPLYIGRRGGTSLPFNGRLYGLAICGGMDDIYKLKKIERYLAQKTGVII